jgi:hypothetical protein
MWERGGAGRRSTSKQSFSILKISRSISKIFANRGRGRYGTYLCYTTLYIFKITHTLLETGASNVFSGHSFTDGLEMLKF